MDPESEKKIDQIILETNAKLEAIVKEMRMVKSSDIDEVTKRQKNNSLRVEFEAVLNEQQERVENIMKSSH